MKSIVSAMPPRSSLPGEEPWVLTEDETTSSRLLKKVESEHKMTAEPKNQSTGNTPTPTQLATTLSPLEIPNARPSSFRTVLHILVDGVADTIESIICKEFAIGMMAVSLILKLILAPAFVQAIMGISVASILLDLIIFTMIKPKTQLQVSERDPHKKSAGSKTIRRSKKESTKSKSTRSGPPDRMTTTLMMAKVIIITILLDYFLWNHGGAQTTHLGDYSCVVDGATGLPTSCELI